MQTRIITTLLALSFFSVSYAQTIMTVGNKNIDLKEYKRVYEKNLLNKDENPYTAAKLKEFTDLYSLFNMKLLQAQELRLDTTEEYQREISTYKNQLASKYEKEDQYMTSLVKEAYDREKKEWNISHIMVTIGGQTAADTARAMSDIKAIRDEIKSGKSFEEIAAQKSADQSTKANGGKVGWVTSMQVPYELESSFVNLKKGDISQPAVSPYGVHIVKLNDVRDNFGEMHVAQILIPAYQVGAEEQAKAKAKADDVYQQLKSNKISWSDAVTKYSEDSYSNQNNGEMEWFGPGKNVDVFEDYCLSLKKGEVGAPIQTDFGYHIIKKLDQRPLASYEERAPRIEYQLKNTDRGKQAKSKSIEQMKKDFGVKTYEQTLIDILEKTDSTKFAQGKISAKDMAMPVYKIENETITFGDVYNQAMNLSRGRAISDKDRLMVSMYNNLTTQALQRHMVDRLIAENEDYRNLIKDYSDGILIFDLMEKNVWQRAAQDTMGLADYYDKNQSKYEWKEPIQFEYFTSSSKDDILELQKTLGKINSVPDEAVAIVKNSKEGSDLYFEMKKQEVGNLPVAVASDMKNMKPSDIQEVHGKFEYYVPVKYEAKPTPKTFTEAKSFVLSDYQNYLNEQWNKDLRDRYKVTINQKVYDSLLK